MVALKAEHIFFASYMKNGYVWCYSDIDISESDMDTGFSYQDMKTKSETIFGSDTEMETNISQI